MMRVKWLVVRERVGRILIVRRAGDIITILDKDASGWWKGELNGNVGFFPSVEWVEEISAGGGHARDTPAAYVAARLTAVSLIPICFGLLYPQLIALKSCDVPRASLSFALVQRCC